MLRGAVLHRLGYEVVARRILRASYGIDQVIPFEPGVHPISLMTQCPDGTLGCKGVMHWFVKKVIPRFLLFIIGRKHYQQLCRPTYSD